MTQIEHDLRDDAATAARAAAERAGAQVRMLETLSELEDGSRLVSRIWEDDDPKAPTSLLRALTHAGNFVAGAFHERRLVGVSIGFFGVHDDELHLHSHITGVDRAFHGRSLGFALKQFQRAWALEHGARTVLWTADPLVRSNAVFNLAKLGATMVAYHANFYGVLEDGLNAGDSDRVVLRWDLESARAARAAAGAPAEPDDGTGCIVLKARADGRPDPAEPDGDVLRAWIPPDIVRVREESPADATGWRQAVRDTVGRALGDGFRAESISRDGWLVLRR